MFLYLIIMSSEQDQPMAKASAGQTILFITIGVLVYIGIQLVMPKVGLSS